MGKHTVALLKKTLEMAMLELKLARELVGLDGENPIDHVDEAEKHIDRAKELMK